jgi:hypothetical protein
MNEARIEFEKVLQSDSNNETAIEYLNKMK